MRHQMVINEEIATASQYVRPPKRAYMDEPSSDPPEPTLDLLASDTGMSSELADTSKSSRPSRASARPVAKPLKSNFGPAERGSSPFTVPAPRVPFGRRPANAAAGPSRARSGAKIRNSTSEEGSYAEVGAGPASEKKRKAQEDAFRGVEPLKDEGPYQYYNQSESSSFASVHAEYEVPCPVEYPPAQSSRPLSRLLYCRKRAKAESDPSWCVSAATALMGSCQPVAKSCIRFNIT